MPDLTLPALKHVQFHDARQGWAVGNDSALYPTGVFRTEDGGRSWVTLPAGMRGQMDHRVTFETRHMVWWLDTMAVGYRFGAADRLFPNSRPGQASVTRGCTYLDGRTAGWWVMADW